MLRRSLLGLLALSPAAALAQDGPQPKLPTEPLVIVTRDGKRHEFQVEMALDPQQQTVRLMLRPAVGHNEGMLFDWGQPRESSMWMRNTIASLDMVFITQNRTILRIAGRTEAPSLANISSNAPARATQQLPAGTAARLDLRVGDKVAQRIFGTAR